MFEVISVVGLCILGVFYFLLCAVMVDFGCDLFVFLFDFFCLGFVCCFNGGVLWLVVSCVGLGAGHFFV